MTPTAIYVECSIPADMTIAEYRRSRPRPASRRRLRIGRRHVVLQ